MTRTDAPTRLYDRSTRKIAIFVGLMFLTATATFATGDALVRGAFSLDEVDSGQLAVGVALHAVCAVAGAAIGAALLGLLGRFNRGLAFGYFMFRALEGVVILAAGAYMLSATSLVNYEPVIYVFTGVAGLMFTYVLLRTGLVPAWLAKLGVVGYIAILTVLPTELLNITSLDSLPGMLLYVPGGLFELFLPLLLIARGFRQIPAPTAPVDQPQPVLAHH